MDGRPSSSASCGGTSSNRLKVQVSTAPGASPKGQSRNLAPASPLGRAGATMLSSAGPVSPARSPPASPSLGTATTTRDRLSGDAVGSHAVADSLSAATSSVTGSAFGADQLEQLADRIATSSMGSSSVARPKDGAAGHSSGEAHHFSDKDIVKFHSAVRWDKPWDQIVEASGGDLKAAGSAKDPKTGNVALHIASQNGHLSTVERLIALGLPVNVQNGKGQTPLHMSVEYDFYFVAKALLAANADVGIVNNDGNKAISGIEGGKVGAKAFDNPVNILKAALTKEQLEEAFAKLEDAQVNGGAVDKAELIQAGMQKKKSGQDGWDHKRFMQLAAKF